MEMGNALNSGVIYFDFFWASKEGDGRRTRGERVGTEGGRGGGMQLHVSR
jgi:hypothetical protein